MAYEMAWLPMTLSEFEAHFCSLKSQCSTAVLTLYTVVRSISQNFGGGGQNHKTPEPIDNKFRADDYVGDDSPHAKTQNERPIGNVTPYMWNITLAWFLPRDSYAKCGICRRRVSVCVCVCVCVSVTLRYCIKTAKRACRITHNVTR